MLFDINCEFVVLAENLILVVIASGHLLICCAISVQFI